MKERAKREKYIPSSFAEWLELKEKSAGNDARTYRYAANSRVEIEGRACKFSAQPTC